MLDPPDITNHAILRHMMKVIVGVSVNIVDREDTKAAIADTERIKIKDSQPLKQEEQTRPLLKERRKRTGKQVKEQQSMILTLGEKVKMKRRKYRRMSPRESQIRMDHTAAGQQG